MTRVRITDPALVPTRYSTIMLPGERAAAILAALIVAGLQNGPESERIRFVIGEFRNSKSEPDLPAIAAAFARGEQVAGAEMEDV